MIRAKRQRHTEFTALLGVIRDGTLDADQYARLVALLAEDEELRRLYVVHAQLLTEFRFGDCLGATCGAGRLGEDLGLPADRVLQDLGAFGEEEVDAGSDAIPESLDGSTPDPPPWEQQARLEEVQRRAERSLTRFFEAQRRRCEEQAYRAYRVRRRRLTVALSSLAALVVLWVCAWLQTWFTVPPAARPTASSRRLPQPVAELTRCSQAQWAAVRGLASGMSLLPGPLGLRQGYAEIRLRSQATVILEAPVEVELLDRNALRLVRGALTAQVPPSAHGFRVVTSSVSVRDLGTAFGLCVDGDGVADVHVLEGVVEASTGGGRDPTLGKARTLTRDQAMRFDERDGSAETIPLNREGLAWSWDDVLYRPRLASSIAFLREAPPSLRERDLRSEDRIYLILERTGVLLTKDLAVTAIAPGRYDTLVPGTLTIAAAVRVDSYLLHWNPASDTARARRITGQISFPRRILGLIADVRALGASDAVCGALQTAYPGTVQDRRLEPKTMGATADWVVLSPDCRSLSVSLRAGSYDQMRVLIAAADEGTSPGTGVR